MPLEATVLIPTHDHGPLLLYSARSALSQTVEEIEVFLIGDGVPDVTREVVSELARDGRVRFFDHPKGPRHGEIYRHAALQEARGEIICYLSDDDLWFPEHVACMRHLLQDADFAHALPMYIDERGEISFYTGDLSIPGYRESLLSGLNFVALSCGAHTTEMYRRLPHGWRTTPAGIPTDLYMWQQFLSQPECRAKGGTRPTVINLPRSSRRDRLPENRHTELEEWSRNLQDQGWRDAFTLRVLDELVRTRTGEAMESRTESLRLHGEIEAHQQVRARLRTSVQTQQQHIGRLRDLEHTVDAIQGFRSWKLLTRLGRVKTRVLGSK